MSEPKQAHIRITKTTRTWGHPCKACELVAPPVVLEGVETDRGIEWPVFAGYHIGYCPHCGLELPKRRKP